MSVINTNNMKSNTKKILKYTLLIIVFSLFIIELLLVKYFGAIIVPWFPPYSINIGSVIVRPGEGDPPPAAIIHPIYPADPTNN